MYTQIKNLADEAIALQNKDRMDAALREISAMCGVSDALIAAQHEAIASGTGAMSTSFSDDGDVTARHIPASELLLAVDAAPAADPVPVAAEPAPTPAAKPAKKGGAK